LSPRLSLKVSPSRARIGLRSAARSASERGAACSGFFLNPTSPQVADASVICWPELDRPTPPTTLATPRIARLAEGDALGRKVTVHQTVTQTRGRVQFARSSGMVLVRLVGQSANQPLRHGAPGADRQPAQSDRGWPPSGDGCSRRLPPRCAAVS
jgi:hypothetical protein